MTEESAGSRRTLYKDLTFSDITIRPIYKGECIEYAVHKVVLCNQSGWFMRALTGRFKESSQNVIEVHDDDPAAFEAMMFFFYHVNIDKESGPFKGLHSRRSAEKDFFNILKCYALADKHDARPFLSVLLKEFKEASSLFLGGLSDIEARTLIQNDYSFCVTTQSEMSIALLTFLFDHHNKFPNDVHFYNLAVQFPNFGTDKFILGMKTRKLVRQHK